jgi:hypothetical protein
MRAAEVIAEEEAAAERALVKRKADDEEAGRKARQAHCDALEEGLQGTAQGANDCTRKRAAEVRTQEGPGKAQRKTLVPDDNKVTAIESSDEEEDDANLKDLLELQAMGMKVVMPPRTRAKETAETLRTVRSRTGPSAPEGGEVQPSRKKPRTEEATGKQQREGENLSVAERV